MSEVSIFPTIRFFAFRTMFSFCFLFYLFYLINLFFLFSFKCTTKTNCFFFYILLFSFSCVLVFFVFFLFFSFIFNRKNIGKFETYMFVSPSCDEKSVQHYLWKFFLAFFVCLLLWNNEKQITSIFF